MIVREFVPILTRRINEQNPLIQVLLGPRQVGKTTAAKQIIAAYKGETIYTSAEQTLRVDHDWLNEKWQLAQGKSEGVLLVTDEIQKIEQWSERLKSLWDAKTPKNKTKLLILGSSSLHIQKGLTESLAGRFELTHAYHWSYKESQDAFSYSLDEYLVYG